MKTSTILLTALSGITAALPVLPSLSPRSPQLCNANADLCSRKYSEVSYIGTHNSAFYGDLHDPRLNQVLSVSQQLDNGIRFLQAQTHLDLLGTLSMCHTDCALYYGGSLETYLTTIKTWLDANPNAVLTLLLTNGDAVNVTEFDSVFKTVGLDTYGFVPSTSPSPLAMSDWPTLGSLVTSGNRLVVFMDYYANETAVPYIMNEFAYFFETPFDTTDPSFNQCSINRPAGASADGRMYIVNHFLDEEVFGMSDVLIPDVAALPQTNAMSGKGSIGAQVNLCEKTYGRVPNFVLLDHFNVGGNWLGAQGNMNFPAQSR